MEPADGSSTHGLDCIDCVDGFLGSVSSAAVEGVNTGIFPNRAVPIPLTILENFQEEDQEEAVEPYREKNSSLVDVGEVEV